MIAALQADAIGTHILARIRTAWPRADPIGSTTMLSRRQALSTAASFVSALTGGALLHWRAQLVLAGTAAPVRTNARIRSWRLRAHQTAGGRVRLSRCAA
jgi:hypothetical protein